MAIAPADDLLMFPVGITEALLILGIVLATFIVAFLFRLIRTWWWRRR